MLGLKIDFFNLFLIDYFHYTTVLSKNPSFLIKYLQKQKALQQNTKGPEMLRLPRQDDYRTFCMSNETEKVYQKLEEVISIC